MTVKTATLSDIDRILEIYDIARSFMRKNGNMTQWINGYPDRVTVTDDVKKGKCYIVLSEEKVCGAFYFNIYDDPTYRYIEGKWLNSEEYGVIHRIGSDGTTHGVLETAIDFAFRHTDNVRIDTHEDNTVMQHLLLKFGFTRCGIIYIEDGSPRVAFHKKAGELHSFKEYLYK